MHWVILMAGFQSPGLRAQIVAPAGMTLFNKNVMVRCFMRMDTFNAPVSGLDVRALAFPCALVWGFHRDTNLIVVAPFAVVDVDERVGAKNIEQTKAGFTDGLVLIRYDGFYKKNVRAGFTRVGGQFGLKLPTGRSGFTSDAVDTIMTVIFSRVRGRNWLVADSQLTLTTTSESGIKQGKRWNYDLAYLHRLTTLNERNLFAVLEANGELVGRRRVRGTPTPTSGGQLFFISPGVEFLPSRRLVIEFSVPVPVARNLNGSQLKPTISLIAGFRYLF